MASERAKQAAAAAAEAETKRKRKVDAFTFGNLVSEWETKHLASMRLSYRRDALGRIRLHLREMLELPAAAITKAAVIAAVDRIAADVGETTARRTIGYARAAYAWASKRGQSSAIPLRGVPDARPRRATRSGADAQ